jgi:hypothetical protein
MVADGEEGRGGRGCGIPAVGAAPAIEGSGGSTCSIGGVSPVWRWLSGDRRWMRCKGGARGGVAWLFDGGEKGAGRKTWLDGGRHFLKEAAG